MEGTIALNEQDKPARYYRTLFLEIQLGMNIGLQQKDVAKLASYAVLGVGFTCITPPGTAV
jgi:hypothetical protein